ncbi:ABC transporter ATP-binding protein [Streptacidiphilus fuscans]|nr:ABC transporter ATP-binding protein [Streptacidiphilus fuscans]
MVSDTTEVEPEDVDDEALTFVLSNESQGEVARQITTAGMATRLPRLMREALALAWRVDPRLVVALLLCQLVSAVCGAFGLLATNSTITALIASGHITARLQQALPAVAVLAGMAGLRALLAIAVSGLSSRLQPAVTRLAQYVQLEAATTAELAAYDHPGFNDRWDLAGQGAGFVADMLGEVQNTISSAASLVAAAVVLAVINPWLLPLTLVAAIPQAVAAIRSARVQYEAMLSTRDQRRVMNLLRWYMGDQWQADQIRSDTIAPFLLGKYSRAADDVEQATNRAVWRGARISLVGSLASGMTFGTVWAVLALMLSAGWIGVASAGTAVFALQQASRSLQGIVGYGAAIFKDGLYLDHWSDFIAECEAMRMHRGTVAPETPQVIAVQKASFTYPGKDEEILHDVDLTIQQGEIVALIGENGSGKSTLMRLLCGLNLPSGGQVTWDGVDTRDMDPLALWRQVAVVPQKFACWPLTVRENIHLGQPHSDGDDAVWEAARATGADEVVGSLRSGLGTLLAKEFWGGKSLSAGEWRRIAVARAIYRKSGLLVLDEPTSDLDPAAEHRIFTQLRTSARGRAVILVTHNLANASVADRIVCMKDGRIAEAGTFAELAEKEGGVFSRLWALQNDRHIPGPRYQR